MSGACQPEELVSCVRSERHTVTVKVGTIQYKLFQIIFQKSDGTMYVNFPYFKLRNGIASLVRWLPSNIAPCDLSLNEGGKVTSHLVKYAHHPDGSAHFSQDGMVHTIIKKQSTPIKDIQGHVFTVQLQGFRFFEPWEFCQSNLLATPKHSTLCFSFNDKEPASIKFAAHWFSQDEWKKRIASGTIGPAMNVVLPDGKSRLAFVCSVPNSHIGKDRVLILYAEPISRLSCDDEAVLTFVGGFDRHEVLRNREQPTTFLALSYPFPSTELTAKLLGSIDLIRT